VDTGDFSHYNSSLLDNKSKSKHLTDLKGIVLLKDKVKDLNALAELALKHKNDGKKIVFTNGCYDILHVGHIQCFQESKRLGNILIVAVNSDRSVGVLKGPSRPIVPEGERAELIAAMESVDYVTIFDQEDPFEVISAVKPDILVKGGDWSIETIVGRELVESYGGKVMTIPMVEGISTSEIIEKIVSHSSPQ
jgi:D-beta-D-heptose 7-phosphate kinase/D-beta-D-heptose 1-phosphate adenosyltransferase